MEVKDLYLENYEILMKDFEDNTKRWKDTWCLHSLLSEPNREQLTKQKCGFESQLQHHTAEQKRADLKLRDKSLTTGITLSY